MALLRFAEFEYDPETRELRRQGRRVVIQEMPLRALEIFLEHPGELVTRDTFYHALWPEDASGLLDDNLNTTLRKLRQALDDSANHPRFVETVPRHGYRFVSAVQGRLVPPEEAVEADAPLPEPVAPRQPEPVPSRSGGRLPGWSAALLLALLLAALLFGGWLWRPGVFSEWWPGGSVSHSARVTGHTLAVLPFANASGDARDDYFCAGLAEEVMFRLGRVREIQMVSRASAAAVQGAGLGAREIGRLLNADTLVEGSVRRSGERLRISVRLVDAATGLQLWSESYDRSEGDVFAVQEEIAGAITRTLVGRMVTPPGEVSAPAQAPPDPRAYDNYLQGRFYWHKRTRDDLARAVSFLLLATSQAPDYAPAWAGLADAYAVEGFYDYRRPTEAFPLAREAAQQALVLDPANASAHATLGYVSLYFDWNLAQGEAHFQRALALRSVHAKTHQWYANLLTAAGRFEEAEREMRRARQLDPLSLIANAVLGWVWYFEGRYAQALEQLALTRELAPDFALALLWQGWTLEAEGRPDEAVVVLREADRLSAAGGIFRASLARTLALSGQRDEAQSLLTGLVRSGDYLPSYEVAKAWLALGERDKAYSWLRRALAERSHSMVFLGIDPQWQAARDDAAYKSILAEVNSGVQAE
ncbi:hypothetical protein FV139_11365 [Parahaliea maris]|uniref:OmpR/PhoB-type domain-containing protein n=1 Tax=Parahaliea maris TaxID=2716870 RepID=A0A5C9A293_9GAMM|nr:winged helix-turn-helix domain-containing protein [Parahaliea maris]TXS94189.1 hypothetical protein FV139_11365 [Parahaliea maris]